MNACFAGSLALSLAGCLASVPVPGPSVHAPYGDHSCEACHDTVGAPARGISESSFSGQVEELSSRGEYGPAPAQQESGSALLRYRVDKLCFNCHGAINPDSPENKGKWLHGPFQAGVCLACHSPHDSVYPKLLTAYPLEKLCGQCHSDFHRGKGAAAYPSRSCADCHSPHYQVKAPAAGA